MRTSRLYIPSDLQTGISVKADDETAHYARAVLRLKAGDRVRLFNGKGGEFSAEIELVTRKELVFRIADFHSCDAESPLQIHLGLGVSKGERMSFAIQKSVELGVASIQPLLTERTVVQLSAEKAASRQAHWQKIARGASEQCGRDRQVPVAEPVRLADWLEGLHAGNRLMLDPEGDAGIAQLELNHQSPVSLCIGPEGGFSELERQKLHRENFIRVRLGPRVLRTETAVLAALAALQMQWGDLG